MPVLRRQYNSIHLSIKLERHIQNTKLNYSHQQQHVSHLQRRLCFASVCWFVCCQRDHSSIDVCILSINVLKQLNKQSDTDSDLYQDTVLFYFTYHYRVTQVNMFSDQSWCDNPAGHEARDSKGSTTFSHDMIPEPRSGQSFQKRVGKGLHSHECFLYISRSLAIIILYLVLTKW